MLPTARLQIKHTLSVVDGAREMAAVDRLFCDLVF